MTFLPIVERELRVAARRRGTYWGRFTAALIGSGLAAWLLAVMRNEPPAEVGGALFATLAALIFVYTAAVGIGVTFDSLSEEKREGTLGLLFLTDLKGYDVVVGKLAATSFNAFYGMLAVLPVLAIPFLMGSVTHAEFGRIALVAVNLLFFLLSIGILASSLCRSDSKALALAILLATIILGAAPLYVAWRSNTNPNYDFSLALVPCPAFGCFLAFDDLYKQGAGASCFVLNTLVTQLYAWTFLLLACWWTPRSWQDASVNQNPGFGRRQWRWLRDGSPARREAARRRLLDINAFLWRAAPNASGSLPLLLVLTGAALLWIGLCRICQVDLSDTDVIIALLFSLNLILKIGLSRAASRPLCEDRRSGALELVLTTPLGAREIVRGQRLALLRQFGPPAMTLFGANFVCLWMGWRNAHDHTFLFWEHLMLNVFLLADLYALSWTGMWFGLRAAKPNRPAVMSIFFILAPPLLAWAVCATIYVLFFESSHPGFGWKLSFTVIGLTGLAIDLLMSVSCRFKLRKNFRRTVAEGKLPARGVP